jgi:histidinol phosphatase-like enzyme
MMLPELVITDRDGVLNLGSPNPASPLYYVTDLDHLVIKPGAKEALRAIRAHGIPTVLATKQRCISKGLVSRERVDLIHARLQRELDFTFFRILIEESAENKRALYERVLDQSGINPAKVWLFDDSEGERTIAARMGITTFDGTNLWEAVCRAFELR